LALHNYHQVMDTFPMGSSRAISTMPTYPGWGDWSAQAMMLPYLEQQPVYNAINFYYTATGNVTDMSLNVNSTAYNTKINSFLCPSDGNAGRSNFNSYYGSVGTTTNVYYNGQTTGLFALAMSNSIASVSDGTSTTIAFSESLTGDNNGASQYRGNGVRGVSLTGYQLADVFQTIPAGMQAPGITIPAGLSTCSTSFQSGSNLTSNKGARWGAGTLGFTLFTTVVPPNASQYKWGACGIGGSGGGADASTFVNAQSNHSGGSNVLMADGSVKFIKDSVSWMTWWSLGTKANGEVISSDSY
ncbi:MAG: DUF1559 domain-containing protein, partial [Isosphaeraceae bacterium]